MTKKQTIIQLYLEGMSKRKIAKNTKKSRNTVDKYVQEFEKGRNEDVRNLAITEEIMRPSTYKEIKGRKKVLTEEVKNILRDYIKENEWKRNHYMSKQQMKKIDMHEELVEAGCQKRKPKLVFSYFILALLKWLLISVPGARFPRGGR
uniref:helix-turn-helix domain-containing protein n=1 Tax=Bacillus fonticola TaxID=2728853 RepID=UPI001472C193|nr:helix-turn-helix domain-containing protein [Bacillus fonticola]